MTIFRTMPALFLAGSLVLASACDDGRSDEDTGGESGGQDRAATILGLTGDAAAGQAIFSARDCSSAGCHGTDGLSGSATPSLDVSVPASTDPQIVNTFLNGKGGMPAQASLSDQELADLLAYVSDTFG